MPDLGTYADAVLGAYGVTFLLIMGIVGTSLWRSRRVKAELDMLETRRKSRG
ncbi:MAG: heme exporter protein CcmD [Cyanobacteria bacterium P01_A01_bin.70]